MNNVIERCPRCGCPVTGVKKNQFGQAYVSKKYGEWVASTLNNPIFTIPFAILAYDNMSKYKFECPYCRYQWESNGQGCTNGSQAGGGRGFTNKQPADFLNVWIEHNVNHNKQRGMKIHTSFEIYCTNGDYAVAAFFWHENGNVLVSNNKKYQGGGGQLMTIEKLTPPYIGIDAVKRDLPLFLPYKEIHVNTMSNIVFGLVIFDDNKNPICVSDRYTFTYSPN